jgi:branched-chain amino acid transport system permease protein
MDILLQQIINGLVLGSMYALIALGYTMVYGIIQLINFAHGEVLMIGALTSWSCIGMMQGRHARRAGWLGHPAAGHAHRLCGGRHAELCH